MKEYIIGKEGTQTFPIAQSKTRVSRRHARITIDDNGVWMLEDLNSTNGTFAIGEDGEMRQVKRMEITEFTRVVLADQTQMGFSFIAHHVIEPDPNDYRMEFRHVMAIHDRALSEKSSIEAKIKRKGYLRFMPSIITAVIGLGLTLCLPVQQKVYGLSVTAVFTALMTTLINVYLGNDKSLKRFSEHYSNLLRCPRCGRVLNENEFHSQMCAVCKAHA